MEVDFWYQWMFIYAYYLGSVLLALAGLILVVKRKSVASFMCLIGFVSFAFGNVMLRNIDADIFEARQMDADIVQLKTQWKIFRASSSFGFLLGGVGLLVLSVRSKKL